ncbi:cyclophilin-like fold protein [Fusobacterium ulcerans]|uniref:cyclophilin-like fold protein n=1 Tax=Fusobacterium ulcerans TaxID=861 RepID=UPI0018D4EF81|nr:cyclophilin-like fold protein [Fusobacterium ulcerans]
MKKFSIYFYTFFIILFFKNYESYSNLNDDNLKKEVIKTINMQIGNKNFTIKLFDNNAAQNLITQLPLTLDMKELNGNEKYSYLPKKLPADSQNISEIKAGDLMLFGSDCLVLFYKNFHTSYSYTKIGYIENIDELTAALGNRNIKVKLNILY